MNTRLWQNETGAGLVEYGLLIALIALIAIVGVSELGYQTQHANIIANAGLSNCHTIKRLGCSPTSSDPCLVVCDSFSESNIQLGYISPKFNDTTLTQKEFDCKFKCKIQTSGTWPSKCKNEC